MDETIPQRSPQDLRARVRAWIEDDPDPRDRAELESLLADADDGSTAARDELADRFSGPLEFGTAGLRGVVAAGPHRMNRAVVQRAAAGLGAWLTERFERPRVVVGLDARHGSREFADDSAAVLVAAGCEVLLLPRPLPTPVLAFAVRRFDADAGVMVTASHNPARDNGYKVYLGGRAAAPEGRGVQIVPPVDAEIAGQIAAVDSLRDLPRATEGWTVLSEDVVEQYLSAITAAVRPTAGRDPRIVLTPMHGVGGPVLREALRRNGFTDVHVVAAQAEADPDFPTVPFPNPEEAGALDLALELAEEVGADLVLAVDPDADRCCVAVPGPAGPVQLSGDELGRLLGDELATPGAVLACSVVSSQALVRVAARRGARFASALTGFKWIARVPDLTFGYEEAIGYCVAPDVVRDKDGLSASLLVAGIVRRELAAGRTLLDLLDDLDRTDGVHLTAPVTIRVDDPAQIRAAMARLRRQPPDTLGGSAVTAVEDLAEGLDGLPPTDGLRFGTADGTRVVVRPSGTEPKLKCYCEVVAEVGPGDDLPTTRARARERLAAVTADVRTATGLG